MSRASVILQSPGGLVKEALHIGATIRMEGFATMVPADKQCFSVWGLIWVSGVRRYISDTSLIGFHAAYREENGEYRESGVANADDLYRAIDSDGRSATSNTFLLTSGFEERDR
ncbi:hypothetical protein DEM27_20285 [Metarhizobium album]|uniref:Uncharacterized protein n=1 Tax=Metarhizobium album TaxID=2182425 RepID=A0A2U2DMA7_9HYPH|nr:hypothetical protein DEM27_20285 [Rhizobium album]